MLTEFAEQCQTSRACSVGAEVFVGCAMSLKLQHSVIASASRALPVVCDNIGEATIDFPHCRGVVCVSALRKRFVAHRASAALQKDLQFRRVWAVFARSFISFGVFAA